MGSESVWHPNAKDWVEVDPRALKFDVRNPRFVDTHFQNEEDIVRYLYERADVSELMQSILSAGYIDFEPMIVLRDSNIVLEGNRRLAALRLIDDDSLRASLKVRLPDIANPAPFPTTVRILLVDRREDARSFIGFKHINGPFKWDALAKAQYAAQWFEEGTGDIETISRTLGDNHSTVRRLVNGWFVLQQAQAIGFNPDEASKKAFAFSHLYIALTRPSVRNFVGLTDGEDPFAAPRANPVPEDHQGELLELMSWLYGQEDKDEPSIIRSQNPNLTQLTKVLGNPEATLILRKTRSLEAAFERIEPQSVRFDEALVRTATASEDVAKYVSHYQGDPTLLSVAENIERTIRGALLVMRDAAGQPKAKPR